MLLTDNVWRGIKIPRALRGSLFRRCAERFAASNIEYVRLIQADDIPEKPPLSLISLLAKGLCQMRTPEKKGPDRSGLGDVGNEVFADVDVAWEGAIVIKQFHARKEQFGNENRFGTDFNIFPDSGFTTLSWSHQKRLGKLSYRQLASHWKSEAFHSIWRKYEGALDSIYKFCLYLNKASLSEDWGGLLGY